MSLLIRAAVLGAIAYVITRSLSSRGERGGIPRRASGATPLRGELHPGDTNVWPTSDTQPAAANAGPTS